MKKLHEYREHAAECREMARTAPPAHRQQLEQMAATWDQLAGARQRKLLKAGRSDDRSEEKSDGKGTASQESPSRSRQWSRDQSEPSP